METAYLGTSNQNNWNIMVSQQNEFTTELGNTKAFIYLRLSEYCWITPSTSSRGLFNNIHWILSFRPHIFFLQHLQYRSKQNSRQLSYLVVFRRAITSARRITRQEGRGGGGVKIAPRNVSGIFFQNHMETAALRVVREKDIAVTHFTKISPLNLFLNGGFWRRITWFSGGNGGGISRRQQMMKKNDCH